MNNHVLKAMVGLGKEKFEGVLGSGQVAVHAIDNNPGSVVDMRGGAPRHHRRFDLVT